MSKEEDIVVRAKRFIEAQEKRNTSVCTDRDVRNFREFLQAKFELRAIEDIEPNELDIYLSEYYMDAKKAGGGEYEPETLQMRKSSLNRYLRKAGYPHDLNDTTLFNMSNQMLAAKKKSLKSKGQGNRPYASRAVTNAEEDTLWVQQQFGYDTPRQLQFTLWYFFTKCFGLRGRDEHRQLKFGDIELVSHEDRKYLTFNERTTKTRDGAGRSDRRENKPRLYSIGTNRDPVRAYEVFLQHRPASMNVPDAPFYLSVMPDTKIAANGEGDWFYPRPMGKNTLGDMMKKSSMEAGIQKKTNHSARKSTVHSLRKAGVPPHKVMQVPI